MKRRHSGLGMPPLVLAGLLLVQLVSAAPLPNAWITDSLAASGAPIWTNPSPGASADFVDPEWFNHSNRFYRAR